ncbi:MAG: cupin domain-containing protein [bacterium]|nr:cupin domain-containing protein [bacterium]
MVHVVKPANRNLQPLDIPGISARASDPIVGKDKNLSAGFSEYTEPGRLEWTFDYNEVFYMLEGALEIHVEGQDPVHFEAGDLGSIDKGTQTTIVIPKRALFVHITQPAWR